MTNSDDAGSRSGRTQGATPSRAELQRSLARVHAELAATPHIEQRSRAMLQAVLADIERLLRDLPPSGPGPAGTRARTTADVVATPHAVAGSEAAPAPERLEGLAVGFESRHPVLAATVREFVELLSRAGL